MAYDVKLAFYKVPNSTEIGYYISLKKENRGF
jgi:hypothetical protein